MNIKGEYRDVLSINGELIVDTGWKSNAIVEDYGRFLAALMKKDKSFHGQQVGIEYIAVGGGDTNDSAVFKVKVAEFFNWLNDGNSGPKKDGDNWVWAKKIEGSDIQYLPEDTDTVTNKLKIDIRFNQNEPSEETLDFKEFALVGIGTNPDNDQFVTDMMFFVNYVYHGQITKDNTMVHTRTINLTFPAEK